MKPGCDAEGQPVNPLLNERRRIDRGLSELLGMVRGILADGVVLEVEAEALARWILSNAEIANHWPADVLVKHLNRIFEDGRMDEDERQSLTDLLTNLSGRALEEFASSSTELPLTRPTPEVIFDQNAFVFTGKFLFGPRRACHRETEIRGGVCEDAITARTRYVVVGSLASRDWIQSGWGRKIERAMELSKFGEIYIVAEETWTRYLMGR